MKERPILFNAAMVRAVIDGSKTQTRRVMKPQPTECPPDYPRPGHWWPSNQFQTMLHVEEELQNKAGHWGGLAGDACPFGDAGDRLWVRETWRIEFTHKSVPHGTKLYAVPQSKPVDERLENAKVIAASPEFKQKLGEAIAAMPQTQLPNGAYAGTPVDEREAFLLNGARFKISFFDGVCGIAGIPFDLNGQWVALVDATDNVHLQARAAIKPAVPSIVVDDAWFSDPNETKSEWAVGEDNDGWYIAKNGEQKAWAMSEAFANKLVAMLAAAKGE